MPPESEMGIIWVCFKSVLVLFPLKTLSAFPSKLICITGLSKMAESTVVVDPVFIIIEAFFIYLFVLSKILLGSSYLPCREVHQGLFFVKQYRVYE